MPVINVPPFFKGGQGDLKPPSKGTNFDNHRNCEQSELAGGFKYCRKFRRSTEEAILWLVYCYRSLLRSFYGHRDGFLYF